MKKFLTLFAVVLLFQSFQCDDDTKETNQNFDLITLQGEKQLILDYLSTFSCDENATCSSIAFGSKACGGPQEFLVFPSSVNLDYLTEQVNNYNLLESAYNTTYGIVSDCMVVMPPENIDCIDGVCTIIQ